MKSRHETYISLLLLFCVLLDSFDLLTYCLSHMLLSDLHSLQYTCSYFGRVRLKQLISMHPQHDICVSVRDILSIVSHSNCQRGTRFLHLAAESKNY